MNKRYEIERIPGTRQNLLAGSMKQETKAFLNKLMFGITDINPLAWEVAEDLLHTQSRLNADARRMPEAALFLYSLVELRREGAAHHQGTGRAQARQGKKCSMVWEVCGRSWRENERWQMQHAKPQTGYSR